MNPQRASVVIAYVLAIPYETLSLFISIIEATRTLRSKKQNIKEDKWLMLWSMTSLLLFQTCLIITFLHKTEDICTKTYWMGSVGWVAAQWSTTNYQTRRLQYCFHTQFKSTSVESLGYPNKIFYGLYVWGSILLFICCLYFPNSAYNVIDHGPYGCQIDFKPGFFYVSLDL